MLLRLTRLSVLLAAVAAGVSVFGRVTPPDLYGDIALMLLGAACLLWRLDAALRTRRASAVGALAPARLLGSAGDLEQAQLRLARAGRSGGEFDMRLHRVGEALQGELGARGLRVYVLDRLEGVIQPAERLGGPGGVRVPVSLAAWDRSPAARALEAGTVQLQLPAALALPVASEDGRVAAVVELTGMDIDIDPRGLVHVLDDARRLLAARLGGAVDALEDDGASARLRCTADVVGMPA